MATTVTDGTTTITPLLLTGYDTTRASTTTAHTIIGRTSGLPDITYGAMGTRTGTLVYYVAGLPNALALEALHTEQLPLTFAVAETGMGFQYVVVGNLAVSLVDLDFNIYSVSVDFVETA